MSKRQREITQLKAAMIEESRRRNIVILGSGSVGKSTIFRAIKIFSSGLIENPDVDDAVVAIRINCCYTITRLLSKLKHFYPEESMTDYEDDIKTINVIENIVKSKDYSAMKPIGAALHRLWGAKPIQKMFRDRIELPFASTSNMDYYLNKVEHVMSESYIVDNEEYLRHRLRTTGIIEYSYEDKDRDIQFRFIDVGGERNERKKWIHCFDALFCTFFVCDLSQFCTRIYEDESVLGLNENLALFEKLTENVYLSGVKMVVILNKTDLFREYLQYHDQSLTFCFGDEYKGRDLNDMHPFKTKCLKRVIKELLLYDIDEMDVDKIGDDVIGIISTFCDRLKCEPLLDLVYKDGIEFIKEKFFKMRSDIMIYELCALNVEQVKNLVYDVNKATI